MTELTLIEKVDQFQLSADQKKPLVDSFGDYFVAAHKLVAIAKGITVTSEDQVEEIKKAKELRKKLKDLRVEANKTRIVLKEGYLRGGNAVQAIYNDIEKITKPEEERLEKQEKFIEIREAQRKAEKYAKRVAELSKYVDDVSIYNLKDMTDEGFKTLLDGAITQFKLKKEAEEKAEAERIKAEEKEKLYRDRLIELAPYARWTPKPISIDTTQQEFEQILEVGKCGRDQYEMEQEQIRIENERLKKEAQENERLAAIEKKKQDEALEKERAAAQKKLDEAKRIAEEAERKLEAEKQAQLEKERKEYEAAEAAKRAEYEAKRQALLAPDKEKLLNLANNFDGMQLPAVSSKEAMAVIRATEEMLSKMSNYIREKAKAL